MLLAALLLQAAAPPDPAGEMRLAIGRAEQNLSRAEACAGDRPAFARRVASARESLFDVSARAEALYGRRATMPVPGVDLSISCARRERYLRAAGAATARADATLARRLSAMPGLWLGPFHLCRDTIESVRLIEDHDGSMQPLITFAPSLRSAVRAETERRVDLPMGLYLDGRLLLAPVIREPITREMMLSGRDDARASDAFRAAAALPC